MDSLGETRLHELGSESLNVETGLFPASSAGDSDIEATIAVPDPCFAPIIFVTSPTGSWFSITGF